MDRLNQLRGEVGGSRDSTLDTSSPPSDSFLTANESSSKYYSLSEVDSTFDIDKEDISSIKEVSLASTTAEAEKTITNPDGLISNLSPIGKKSDILDNYKIDTQIEAANILSGGVAIFDDNSYDGNELVIDDNVDIDDKSNSEPRPESPQSKADVNIEESVCESEPVITSNDTTVSLQINGKNVELINVGNQLYLYTNEDNKMAALQIIDDDQEQPTFKFLKVRNIGEDNLEVYEEIERTVKENAPAKEGKTVGKTTLPHVPISDINKVISESTSNKTADKQIKGPQQEPAINIIVETENKEVSPESKTEVNFNGKTVKLSESRKSPIGSFTTMTYHSTPIKEGISLVKSKVDQQLHNHSHLSNVKKTIEVYTDNCKKPTETPTKCKDLDIQKIEETIVTDKGPCETNEINIKENEDKEVIETITTKENTPVKPSLDVENVDGNTIIKDDVPINVQELTKSDTEILSSTAADEDHDTVKAIEIYDEVELTTTEAEPCDKNSQADLKENSKIEPEEPKKREVVESVEVDVDEPILIDDDDISVVEVVVDSKSESENELPNTKDIAKIDKNNEDDVKYSDEIIAIPDEDNSKAEEITKNNTDSKVDEMLYKDLATKSSDVLEPRSTVSKNTVTLPLHEVSKDIKTSTEIKNNSNVKLLSSQTQTMVSISLPSTDIVNVHQEKDALPSSINVSKLLSLESDNIQNSNPIENSEGKHATLKEDIVKNVSPLVLPLLEQKQQSLVAEKSGLLDKNEVKKHSPNIYNTSSKGNTVANKIEGKVVEVSSESTSIKAIPITQSAPVITDMQIYDGKTPISNDQISTKADAVNTATSAVDVQKPLSVDKARPVLDNKLTSTIQKDNKKYDIMPQKPNVYGKSKGIMNIEISKVPKLDASKTNTTSKQSDIGTSGNINNQNLKSKIEPKYKKEVAKMAEKIPINNDHVAVPFGKWTDANRQEFLNKFKIKASVVPSNSNQLKNSNDLNRRDVLKKINSQRQSNTALSKSQEAGKHTLKPETAAFTNKPNIIIKESAQVKKAPQKSDKIEVVSATVIPVTTATKTTIDSTISQNKPNTSVTNLSQKEVCQSEGNVQNIIDKTIEGMIHRNVPTPKSQSEPKKSQTKHPGASKVAESSKAFQPLSDAKLDEIEMKMNELHGIPFIERPPHELPQVYKPEPKKYSHVVEKEKPTIQGKTKIPNLLPFSNKNQQKVTQESVDVDSEEELIEHEPITGDIDITKKNPQVKEKISIAHEKPILDASTKKDAIITEKDFDKFARRNSITYENCLTVNFDAKKSHNVVQTVIEKEPTPKNSAKNDMCSNDPKTKLIHQNVVPNLQPAKEKPTSKLSTTDDGSNKTQSKVQKAYYSALSEKKQNSNAITILENKPVKVLFVHKGELNSTPAQLNVQGPALSPNRNTVPNSDVTVSTREPLSSDRNVTESVGDPKSLEDSRTKSKHQRKQVLTPVEEPELELIEPRDLGIEGSPKKKRKIEEDKVDRNPKHPMRKNYLLSSNIQDNVTSPTDVTKSSLIDSININDNGVAKSSVSALDSLVKAAELIETQTEKLETSTISNPLISDIQSNTPAKRGRGRPRKYPLTPDGTVDKTKVITPSPQKKPRLIDAIKPKRHVVSDDSDSDEELIKENWTMGKINENIVCPICNKLFRTENVVFKHVKHCTGPSPSRSDSDKTSPKEIRRSLDSDSKSQESKSDDMDIDDDKPLITQKLSPKKRKSNDSMSKQVEKDEVIVIEDTPIKEKPENIEARKHISRQPKTKIPLQSSNLVCEFCGKTFRQLSYLVSHKLQHKKPEKVEPKTTEKQVPTVSKSVFSCEVCKKEFRKLHHLVQHRFIHNSISTAVRPSRKSSFEQSKSKAEKEPNVSKQSDDPAAGFRCEPCDKSFRKLHHLVEHRETHDGINRQKSNTTPVSKEEKNVEQHLHQCDICKKTFKKSIQLKEHKEQHIETSSEKSDDKSVKSSLSTKDIIHECSLCYMVFPNEHSLNKHGVICLRKKRQSKQVKPPDETNDIEEVTGSPISEDKIELDDSPKVDVKEIEQHEEKSELVAKVEPVIDKPAAKDVQKTPLNEKSIDTVEIKEKEKSPQRVEAKLAEPPVASLKRAAIEPPKEVAAEVPQKIKKVEQEPTKIHETPKKKAVLKEKNSNSNKRPKSTPTTQVVEEVKPDSSDDDEVRYMLNPNFKVEDVAEEKVFMKVRAKKRSSLQIERPDSKDLVKRRTSLQYPPKIPRLKPKPVDVNTTVKKELVKPKLEPVPSTDSDDSDTTKYSFPSTVIEKSVPAQSNAPKESERKSPKKSLADKRKSLTGIAKRKSLGQAVTVKHKLPPLKPVKKRTLDAEHRCDCGQLFSSAALLSRHTTLAHTPPRIRRRRSPSPDVKPALKGKPVTKTLPRKSVAVEKPEPTPASRKSTSSNVSAVSTKPTKTDTKRGKKSVEKAAKSPSEVRKAKPPKVEEPSVKSRRTGAHRGVPIPEKMRKLLEKIK